MSSCACIRAMFVARHSTWQLSITNTCVVQCPFLSRQNRRRATRDNKSPGRFVSFYQRKSWNHSLIEMFIHVRIKSFINSKKRELLYRISSLSWRIVVRKNNEKEEKPHHNLHILSKNIVHESKRTIEKVARRPLFVSVIGTVVVVEVLPVVSDWSAKVTSEFSIVADDDVKVSEAGELGQFVETIVVDRAFEVPEFIQNGTLT
jgi:hypothetical protein